jgi:hypothetical protein
MTNDDDDHVARLEELVLGLLDRTALLIKATTAEDKATLAAAVMQFAAAALHAAELFYDRTLLTLEALRFGSRIARRRPRRGGRRGEQRSQSGFARHILRDGGRDSQST